jgi:hypothetical protein
MSKLQIGGDVEVFAYDIPKRLKSHFYDTNIDFLLVWKEQFLKAYHDALHRPGSVRSCRWLEECTLNFVLIVLILLDRQTMILYIPLGKI